MAQSNSRMIYGVLAEGRFSQQAHGDGGATVLAI